MNEAVLDVDRLLTEAQRQTELSDFGPSEFLEGLRKIVETYNGNGFDDRSLSRVDKRLKKILTTRLRIEDALRRWPDIKRTTVTRPLYITGLPRTGTTAMLNLLASDAATRPLQLWEALNPYPLPEAVRLEEDPRYMATKKFCDGVKASGDGFQRIHHFTPETPEECVHLLNHTFQDVQYGVEPLLEPYKSWFIGRDLRSSYYYYRDILKMLQWQRPGKRWLLKSPCHLWALDILAEIFPDCQIVVMHRNPVDSVISYASMMASLMDGCRDISRAKLGEEVLEYLARKVERSMALREHITSRQIHDVYYADLLSDPLGVVERLYDYFGLPLSQETSGRMAASLQRNPQNVHGAHTYAAEDFGLTEARILDRFGPYVEHYRL